MNRIKQTMHGFYLPEKLMTEFQQVGREQGLSQSALLRVLAIREIRRHKKEIAESEQ